MTTPFWCLLAAVLLPYVLAGFGVYYKSKQLGTVDNEAPREQATRLTGAGARAVAAQQNAWEALAVFTAAVLVAHFAGADPGQSATASIVFLVARVLHPVFYIRGLASARSASFFVGFLACLWLFVLAARA